MIRDGLAELCRDMQKEESEMSSLAQSPIVEHCRGLAKSVV
jgi:hypothetical protein